MGLDTGVSLQPAVQRTSRESNKLDLSTCNSFHPSQRSSSLSHQRLFSNKVLISPEADNRFLFQFAWHARGRHADSVSEAFRDESVEAPLRREAEGGEPV